MIKAIAKILWAVVNPKVKHLILYPAGKCNLRCKHCFVEDKEGELSFKEIEKVSKEISPIWLEIGGGEPFLRDNLVDICRLFKSSERITIPTNGWFKSKITADCRSLAELGNVTIIISLEGFKETHDKIRGKGSFERAMKTFESIKRIKGLRIGFSTTLSKANSEEVVNFVKEMKKYEPDFHGVILLRGKPSNKDLSLPSLSRLREIEKELANPIRDKKYGGGLRSLFEKNYVSYRRYLALRTLEEKKLINYIN